MELSREQVPPGAGERAARTAVIVFLFLAMITLAFGLGWGIKDLFEETPAATTGNAVSAGGDQSDTVGAAIIDEIVDLLQKDYVDKAILSDEMLRQAAIDGIITALNDTHTEYLTPAELANGALSLNSSYDGIGATVSDSTGEVTIVAPFRDSPAEKAGIRPGDVILEVDGESIVGWTQTEAVQIIRGPQGTEVTLKVRHTDGTEAVLTIVRGNIPLESVFVEPNLEVIPGESGTALVDRNGDLVTDVAYVAITQFHDQTLTELRTKLADIEDKGFKGLIIDVRSNPGGLLGATIDVTDEFMESGTILSQQDSEGKLQSWTARSGGLATSIPIVILQDGGSASGAEVFAAALQENGRATVLGTRSFGKGTVNRLQPLTGCGDPAGCGALYLSVARWLTPDGNQIEGLGVKPDVELAMTYDLYIDEGDIQIFAAIDILRGN